MDPLSITASVVSITSTCLKITKSMSDLKDKYRHAQVTISALCAESTVICAALSQIQGLILKRPDLLPTQLKERSEMVATFDIALTGCVVVLAVLEDEISSLALNADERDVGWREKAKFMWKEGLMNDLLQQLRGQQHAIGLLVQLLQIEAIGDVHNIVSSHGLMLERMASQTRSLRSNHPRVKAPQSVIELSVLESANNTIYGEGTAATDTSFIFDDLIVNSKVYRRVLAQARQAIPQPTSDEEEAQGKESKAHTTNFSSFTQGCNYFGRIKNNKDWKTIRSRAALDEGFTQELSTMSRWFCVLSSDERSSSLFRLFSEFGYLYDHKRETVPQAAQIQEEAHHTESATLASNFSSVIHGYDTLSRINGNEEWKIIRVRADIDKDFIDELSAISKWFCVLSSDERSSTLFHFLSDFGYLHDHPERIGKLHAQVKEKTQHIEVGAFTNESSSPTQRFGSIVDGAFTRIKNDEECQMRIIRAEADTDFIDEISAISNWFCVLNDDERCCSLFRLLDDFRSVHGRARESGSLIARLNGVRGSTTQREGQLEEAVVRI